jgi:hypothetical protein
MLLNPLPQRWSAYTAAQTNQRRVRDLLEHLHPPQSRPDICTHLDQGKWKRCLFTTQIDLFPLDPQQSAFSETHMVGDHEQQLQFLRTCCEHIPILLGF